MTYRTILVHADLSRNAPGRIRLAAAVAAAQGAHLIGLAAIGVPRVLFPNGYDAAPGTLGAGYFDPLHEAARRALDQFATIAGGAGVSFETRLLCDSAEDALAQMARFCDLVVISQDDPDETLTDMSTRLPEYVMLNCSRPILVAPRGAWTTAAGQKILVAWNGSKEASSAINAALPLLQAAAQVTVASMRASSWSASTIEEELAELAVFLERHGVKPEMLLRDEDIDAGNRILSLAAEHACDLVVMGCYGHSQFRELCLGGATRTVLSSARLPVLMAR
jgi:nucleotide-binding universal stress UspA family protein